MAHPSHPAWSDDALPAIVAAHQGERGALLPILREIQDRFGYVDAGVIGPLALALNVSQAEVHGVVTFYSDFSSQPGGRVRLRVCRAEACQSMGGRALLDHARALLGVDLGETTPDGAITLESVMCLGNCALSPAVMVDGQLAGRVDRARFDELVAQVRAGNEEPAGGLA